MLGSIKMIFEPEDNPPLVDIFSKIQEGLLALASSSAFPPIYGSGIFEEYSPLQCLGAHRIFTCFPFMLSLLHPKAE
jgi:hypothetical protein